MKSYKEFTVWQKSMDLVILIYTKTSSFPKSELYSLTNQIRKCAISIPSNIAEGFGRYHKPDFIRFLTIAKGSLYELQTQLEISNGLEYLSTNDYKDIESQTIEIAKMLNSLIKKLKSGES